MHEIRLVFVFFVEYKGEIEEIYLKIEEKY